MRYDAGDRALRFIRVLSIRIRLGEGRFSGQALAIRLRLGEEPTPLIISIFANK